MKNNLNTIKTRINVLCGIVLFFICFSSFAQINPASSCDNLDFRRGDFTNWVGRTSVYPCSHPSANNCPGGTGPMPYYMNTGIVPGRHTIMSTSTPDPYACNNIMTLPPNEPFCARLGNGGIGAWGDGVKWQVDYLSYTYTVNATNNLLTYKYAVVFQDPLRDPTAPPHPEPIRPRFVAKVMDSSGALIDTVCGILDAVYDTLIVGYRECSLPDIQSMGGNPLAPVGTAYRAWTTVGVDLRNYAGQNITIEFNTWDCGWGGHFGYAYVSARCDAFKLTTQNCTSNGAVLVQAPPGFSYQWFPSGATTQDTTVNNPNPGDSVWVELTTVSGCKTIIGTRLYPLLIDAKFNVNKSIVCANTPITFSDSSTSVYTGNNSIVPIVSWNWDFGNGSTSNIQNPIHAYANSGTYIIKLIATNQTGCVDSTTHTVQILPGPVADFVFNDVCSNSTATFTDVSQATFPQFTTNWLWTFHNSSASTSQNSSFFYNVAGTYTINLQVTTDQGCKHDTTKTIKIYPLPIANFTASQVCVGNATFFANLSSKVDSTDNIVSAVWNFGDGSALSSSYSLSHVYLNSGTYQVQLIVVTNKGCVKDTTISVTVYPKPVANFVANTPCLGTPATFTDLSTPANIITNWLWNFDDAINNTSNQQNPTHVYNTAMVYYPTLIISSQYGCVDSLTVPVDIAPLPVVVFDADKYNGCAPLCVNFIDLSYFITDPIVNWDWDFGDGGTSTIQSPAHCYTNPGTYTVKLTAETANSCTQSLTWSAMINVYPYPNADFEADPYETGESTPLINFHNHSTGENSWQWYFGDNSGSNAEDTSHTYAQAGTYTIWLHVQTQYGCKDSIAKEIVINKEWTFYVPNAFTPAISSGANDGFIGKGTNIQEYEMWIFDRWGNQIYYCNSLDEPWYGPVDNGNNGETTAQIDVYVWKIKIKDLFGKPHRYIGTVTLVR